MPLIGTTGAASARGFGLFAASLGAPAYLATVGSSNYINAIAVDSQNNSIIIGPSGVAGTGAPIMKVSPAGVVLWAKNYGVNSCLFRAVVCDSSDNIYAVGEGPPGGAEVALIVKFDSSGNILWQRQQSAGNAPSYPRSMWWAGVKIMPNGNIAVGGTYRDNIQYSTCCGPVKLERPFFSVAVYNSSGTLQWARRFGATSINSVPSADWTGYSIGVDSSNNIYLTGFAPAINTAGTNAIPIIKYNSTGTYQWGYMYKNSTSTISNGGYLAVSSSDNIYAVSPNNPYVIKVDSSGTFQWGRDFRGGPSGNAVDVLRDITVDSTENVYAVGRLGNGSSPSDATDYFIYKVDSSGTTQFLRSLGRANTSSQDETAQAIAITADNFYCVGGRIQGISTQLFGRLKTDGSQTGTYSVGGTNYTYDDFSGIFIDNDTATRTDATATPFVSSASATLTYTETTPSYTMSNSGVTITVRSL